MSTLLGVDSNGVKHYIIKSEHITPDSPSYMKNEYTKEKIGIIRDYLSSKRNIKTARDLGCLHSNKPSTADLLIELGLQVYGYGNEVRFTEERDELTIFYTKDVTKLPFHGETAKASLGEYKDVSIIDFCGYTDPEFCFEVAKHSKYTILIIPSQVGRVVGRYHGISLDEHISEYLREGVNRGLFSSYLGKSPKLHVLGFERR